MIVRISFLSTLFVLICACGTSQGPRFQDALNTPSFTYNKLSDTERDRLSAEIKLKYDKLLGNRGFSGQILVAKNGEIIFEDYKGYSNLSQKSPIIPETPIHLASVSKTFTGMVAMKLCLKISVVRY
jgi:CubicO group peptidase (beta-lactamase class C family)